MTINNIGLNLQIDKYLTIGETSTGAYKEKGSKFLSFAYPLNNDKETRDMIDILKKEYFDARHHCYAYRIGADKLTFRANDDGEPSGTAGKPILGQIISNDLTNILIVVVRYFGGTLLGTSGLIHAYKSASASAIANARIVERYVFAHYRVSFHYQHMNQIMKIVKDHELNTYDLHFELECSFNIKVRLSKSEHILSKFTSIDGVKAQYITLE